jgi:hypothetical protein
MNNQTDQNRKINIILAILFGILIAIAFIFFSCTKVERSDFFCTHIVTNQIDSMEISRDTFPNLYRDLTDNEAIMLIKLNTYTGYRCSNGINYTVKSTMQCGEVVCP